MFSMVFHVLLRPPGDLLLHHSRAPNDDPKRRLEHYEDFLAKSSVAIGLSDL